MYCQMTYFRHNKFLGNLYDDDWLQSIHFNNAERDVKDNVQSNDFGNKEKDNSTKREFPEECESDNSTLPEEKHGDKRQSSKLSSRDWSPQPSFGDCNLGNWSSSSSNNDCKHKSDGKNDKNSNRKCANQTQNKTSTKKKREKPKTIDVRRVCKTDGQLKCHNCKCDIKRGDPDSDVDESWHIILGQKHYCVYCLTVLSKQERLGVVQKSRTKKEISDSTKSLISGLWETREKCGFK